MSGHSKWASIKRGKGIADGKRSAVFSKLSSAITIAAKHGADPTMNFQLRIAIDKAKTANMPKDNIERAVERAKGVGASALQETTYEVYGPGGTAFMIETATDNHNRTIGEIRAVLNHYNVKLAENGSVGYLFKKRGQLIIPINNNVDEIELALIEANAEDYEVEGDKLYAYTDPKDLEKVRQNLASQSIEAEEVGFELHPTTTVTITDPDQARKIINFHDAIEDITDVTAVTGNFDLEDYFSNA